MNDAFPVALSVIKHPIIPQITLVLATQRLSKQIRYDEYLIVEAVKMIDLANGQFRGCITDVNVDSLVSGLKFDDSFIKCYFTLIFKNDYVKERFLSELIKG